MHLWATSERTSEGALNVSEPEESPYLSICPSRDMWRRVRAQSLVPEGLVARPKCTPWPSLGLIHAIADASHTRTTVLFCLSVPPTVFIFMPYHAMPYHVYHREKSHSCPSSVPRERHQVMPMPLCSLATHNPQTPPFFAVCCTYIHSTFFFSFLCKSPLQLLPFPLRLNLLCRHGHHRLFLRFPRLPPLRLLLHLPLQAHHLGLEVLVVVGEGV